MPLPSHLNLPAIRTVRVLRVLTCALLAVACLTVRTQSGQVGPNQGGPPSGGAVRMDKVNLPTAINQPPDANAQMEMREGQTKPQDFKAANAERRRQIADDSAHLLKLATQLKAEVDKTTKDTLSLNVIRDADDIERLAHSVKEKMKLVAGATN
jgi:hypothetical protein